MKHRPRPRRLAWRRSLRERAAHVEVSSRLAGLLALAIARWGYRLQSPQIPSRQPPRLGLSPRTALRLTYAWADVRAQEFLDDATYYANFERAVTVYDHILIRHLPAEEARRAVLQATP